MADFERYKWPVITLVVTSVVLMIMLSIGFTVGILSEDPDGLERVLEDLKVAEPEAFWVPFFSFITNDYVAGILGLILTTVIIGGVFYLITNSKKKRTE
ncbi:MAG: hypothetical protein ACQERB_02795 [Promethearchaeati archaeon]